MNKSNQIIWCIEQHQKTNHYYDKYLPYEMHLRMVVQVFEDFKHLLKSMFTDSKEIHRGMWEDTDVTFEVIELACWGHDLIEDARCSYNDCKQNFKVGNFLYNEVADIIYAVSNEKGKTREERANKKYYKGIRDTPGATFVKLCDRIANVRWGKLTKSKMLERYKEENHHFLESVAADRYPEMKQYLINLFND